MCKDCSYSYKFIENLQNQVDKSLAKAINRQNASRKRDLNIPFDQENFLKLSQYNDILEKIKHCSSCYKNMNLANVVMAIKTVINKN